MKNKIIKKKGTKKKEKKKKKCTIGRLNNKKEIFFPVGYILFFWFKLGSRSSVFLFC